MPRDGSGVYVLPIGNPVASGTVITSTWANSTLTDITAQLNNVITRDGILGPTNPLKVTDGSAAAPSLSFNTEPSTGFYRIPSGQIGISIQGTKVGTWSSAGLAANISGTPLLLKSGGATVEFDGATATLRPISDQSVRLGDSTHRWSQIHAVRLTMYSTGGSDVVFNNTASANVTLNSGPASNSPVLTGQKNSKNRWVVILGNANTESGSNAGSHFSIDRYADDGATWLGSVLTLYRNTGNLEISGDTATKVGGGTWSAPSDAILKENIEDYQQGLMAVTALRPRTFRFKGQDPKTYIGLVAQEVEPVMPEMVFLDKDLRMLDATALTYALVNAVKELNVRLMAAGL